MLFRQLLDPETKTFTYLLADSKNGDAVIIDSVLSQVDRDLLLLKELNLNLKYLLETHCHADHITGAAFLKMKTGAQTVVGKYSQIEVADRYIVTDDVINFGSLKLKALETPGHTLGCISYLGSILERKVVFTGDALFVRGCGRTDFQGGCSKTLYQNVYKQLYTLPDNTLIYPGHDYKGFLCSTIKEEKEYNPRLQTGISEKEFVQIMNSLQLDLPKAIDVAVPANRRGGTLERQLQSL
jgi:sulfur dioxygenase